MAATVQSFAADSTIPPALQPIVDQAVNASNDAANVFLGPDNDKPNTVYAVPNDPPSLTRANTANMAARVSELRSADRETDASELEAATDATKSLTPFIPVTLPAPIPDNLITNITECRHFRLGAARLTWAFLTAQATVALLPASPPLPLVEAAQQLLEYATRRQRTTRASLDAGAAFSMCAKWVYADDRAALLAVLRAGSGAPLADSEKPGLARLAFQILLLDNQAARRHGFKYEPVELALGATTDVFPTHALEKLVACANGVPTDGQDTCSMSAVQQHAAANRRLVVSAH